ncbi:MAG: DsbA family protein [Ahrensia sp.]|nr:DsbA family protein [Ahrensia sp.]
MISIITHPIRIGAAAAALLFASATLAPVALALDDSEKAQVEQIIRDYLLANPELMIEVQQALEVKQQAEAQEQAARALTENRGAIFNSPNQGVIGNANGDVTVVEFFDYNCSFCQRAMQDMNALLDGDENLRFVMKELPILSTGSVEASRISTAVYRLYPDRYGEFHNGLLSLQGLKDGARAIEVAGLMGLDIEKLEEEAGKDNVVDAFREANDLATALGVNGTPSYVIGDEVVFGALGEEVLREKIDNMRNCGKTQCS